jgi:hypothetical protein
MRLMNLVLHAFIGNYGCVFWWHSDL